MEVGRPSWGVDPLIREKDSRYTEKQSQDFGGNKIGDTVTTTLTIKFPSNAQKNTKYILTDVIPSGMRYTGYKHEYNSNYYLSAHELQKLYFVVTNKNNSDITITYNSRNLLPGEYFVDSAVVENPKENLKGYSSTSSFLITE